MKKQIKLAGYYGIDGREVEITAEPSRLGVRVIVVVPAEGIMSLSDDVAEMVVSWDDIEENSEAVRLAALNLARQICSC